MTGRGPTGGVPAFGPSPRDEPLSYPGVAPETSGLVTGDSFVPFTVAPAHDLAEAPLLLTDGAMASSGIVGRSTVTLDDALVGLGAAPMAARVPVLAVGSNASPAQLHAKFHGTGASPVVPLTWANVTGVRVGVAAMVSRRGYVPAAPVFDPAATSRLAVTWLDGDQLAVVDATEGGYQRRLLDGGDSGGPAVGLDSGDAVGGCGIYVSRTGVLAATPDGVPLPLVPQRELIGLLLATGGPALAELAAGTAEGFVAAALDPDRRPRLAAALRSATGLQVVHPADPTTPAAPAPSRA